jgi:hypothetical protein
LSGSVANTIIENGKVKILLVGNQQMMRQGLRQLLAATLGLRVVGEASDIRNGAVTDQLCTNCLISRLAMEIRGKSILFVEPLTMDGYCYAPSGDVGNQARIEAEKLTQQVKAQTGQN